MKYKEELQRSMTFLGQHPDTIFLGQSVTYPGTAMYDTLSDVSIDKRIEMVVAEDLQMGITNGLALDGKIPVSIFPRWNFFLLATNQLVNHLDKIPMFSDYKTKVIIRVGIGSERPLHPQHQHVGDYTDAFELMCNKINIIRLDEPDQIFTAYQIAYESERSSIIVEWGDFYNEK